MIVYQPESLCIFDWFLTRVICLWYSVSHSLKRSFTQKINILASQHWLVCKILLHNTKKRIIFWRHWHQHNIGPPLTFTLFLAKTETFQNVFSCFPLPKEKSCRSGMTLGWLNDDNFHFWVNYLFKLWEQLL